MHAIKLLLVKQGVRALAVDNDIKVMGWIAPQEHEVLVDPAVEKTIVNTDLPAFSRKTAPVSDRLLGESSVVQIQPLLGRPVASVGTAPHSFSASVGTAPIRSVLT